MSDDSEPVSDRMWSVAGRAATVGSFVILFGAFLYFAEAVLMPVLGAAVIATMLSPLVRHAKQVGVPPWVTAIFLVGLFGLLVAIAATAMAGPVGHWIARAPEIGSKIAHSLSVFAQPLDAVRSLERSVLGSGGGLISVSPAPTNVIVPVLSFVTPAAAELVLFFAMLVFILASQIELQHGLAMMFSSRESKLRALKIIRGIERNLTRYLTVVTAVNVALGTLVALGAWAIGLPNPAIFGTLAAILNYLPYIGPGVTVFILFGVGLVSFDSVGHALIAPLGLIGLATLEGHVITPTIVGRRLTLNPLVVFLGLAFWSWLWGPVGAFFAVPLTIVFLVVYRHLAAEDGALPLE